MKHEMGHFPTWAMMENLGVKPLPCQIFADGDAILTALPDRALWWPGPELASFGRAQENRHTCEFMVTPKINLA